MRYRVVIERPAWQDIDEAYEWLHKRVPERFDSCSTGDGVAATGCFSRFVAPRCTSCTCGTGSGVGSVRSSAMSDQLPRSVAVDLPADVETLIAAHEAPDEGSVWTTVIHGALWEMRARDTGREAVRRELAEELQAALDSGSGEEATPEWWKQFRARCEEDHRRIDEVRREGLLGNLLLPAGMVVARNLRGQRFPQVGDGIGDDVGIGGGFAHLRNVRRIAAAGHGEGSEFLIDVILASPPHLRNNSSPR